MKNKWKGRLITVLIVLLFVVLAADVVAIIPSALPWILGVFAIPGVWCFSKLLYLWVTTDDEPVKIQLPSFGKKGKDDDTKTYSWYVKQAEKLEGDIND